MDKFCCDDLDLGNSIQSNDLSLNDTIEDCCDNIGLKFDVDENYIGQDSDISTETESPAIVCTAAEVFASFQLLNKPVDEAIEITAAHCWFLGYFGGVEDEGSDLAYLLD